MTSSVSLSYTSAISGTPLLGDTIGDNLERAVARHGDREALVDVPTHRRWTYNELDVEVDELARGLLELGVEKGDRVGIWSPNCAEWVLLQYATAKVGAILVNVNPSYRSHELRYVVNQSGMRLLVSAVSHKTSDYRRWWTRSVRTALAFATWSTSARSRGAALVERGGAVTTSGFAVGCCSSAPMTRSTSSTRPGRRASPRAPR